MPEKCLRISLRIKLMYMNDIFHDFRMRDVQELTLSPVLYVESSTDTLKRWQTLTSILLSRRKKGHQMVSF